MFKWLFKWLMPKEKSFFDFFEKHIYIAIDASQELLALLSADKAAPEIIQRIQQLEHQADAITHECVDSLHKTFITPFERNDIYRLISAMDDVVDYIEEIASRIATYKIEKVNKEAKDMATLLVQCTHTLAQAVNGLRHLKNSEEVHHSFINISQLEKQADTTVRQAIAKLFEEQRDAIVIIKWKEIYENIEEAIDCCEDVSNIIEGIIMESN